jgi:crotonobetainyl-CoA:carnitine CoA-transferase CaiB-like acyl-CoA transferase
MSISWYGPDGPYAKFEGSDAQIFALNGMLRGIGRVEGPPLIPTGVQAQIVGGMTAYIGALGHVLARELGNLREPLHLHTSIFEASLCFTEVGAITYYNTGLQASRMGVNRFPPTYPLGVYPCRDGWLGVTVLTPGQWRSFCALLGMLELADVPLFQSSASRLEAADIIEPLVREKLLLHSAEDLFYRGQAQAVPLARVPTMAELFGVDQFVQRRAFSEAQMSDGVAVKVPSVPFRLFATPPNFGGPVARLGEHTAMALP